MTSPQHFLALRPCIELLTVGSDGRLIPAASASLAGSARNLAVGGLGLFRLGEHIEIRPGPTSNTTSFFLLLSSGGLIVYLLYKSLNDENQSGVQHQPSQLTDTTSSSANQAAAAASGQRWSAQNWLRWLLFGDTSDLRGQYFGPIQPGPPTSELPLPTSNAPTKVSTMKQMAQIVYVSPCPNCVRGVCKIKKHHQLLYHRHQFVPILESASTSGSTTPNRLQMLEQSATSAGSLKSTPNQKQSKTADCRCLIQFSSSISQNPGFLGIYPDRAQIPFYQPWLGSLAINLTVGAIH